MNLFRLKIILIKKTQYNTLNVKLSHSQLNKLKSAITNRTLNLSSNLTENSNDETNFPYKLLSTNTQVSKIYKDFPNGSSPNIKFSKTQLSNIVQSEGFIFGPPNEFISLDVFDFTKRLMSLVSSIAKESKNLGAKKLNKDTFVDAGLNLIDKKIKKGISSIADSGVTLTNNKMKDIIKVK